MRPQLVLNWICAWLWTWSPPVHIKALLSEKYLLWRASLHFNLAALRREGLSLAGLEPTGRKTCSKNSTAVQFRLLESRVALQSVYVMSAGCWQSGCYRAALLRCRAPGWCCSLGGWRGPGPTRSQQKNTPASCVESLSRTAFHLNVVGFVV